MKFVRYHVASGAIDIQLTITSEQELQPHAREGYEFLEVAIEADPNTYVVDGQLRVSDTLEDSRTIRAFFGETVTLADLPDQLWFCVDDGEPFQMNGTLTLDGYETDRDAIIMPVGAVQGPAWVIRWRDEQAMKTQACELVDRQAEAAKSVFQTPGEQQSITYLRKADAARAFISGQPISEVQEMRLEDEAMLRKTSVLEAAQMIVEQADRAEYLDACVDRVRLKAKQAIRAASEGHEIDAALTGLDWTSKG